MPEESDAEVITVEEMENINKSLNRRYRFMMSGYLLSVVLIGACVGFFTASTTLFGRTFYPGAGALPIAAFSFHFFRQNTILLSHGRMAMMGVSARRKAAKPTAALPARGTYI